MRAWEFFILKATEQNVETHRANVDEIAYFGILNKVLPPEIRVIAWSPVKESFRARFEV